MIHCYTRSVGSICPACLEINDGEINIFQTDSENLLTFCCCNKECQHDFLTIRHRKDKYIIDIKCHVCGETHRFSISETAFWNKDFFSFSCPMYSEAEIVFMGTKKRVLAKIDELDCEENVPGENDPLNADIMYRIIDKLNELVCRNAISCHCESHVITPYMSDAGILLECEDCGEQLLISLTKENLDALKKLDSICVGKTNLNRK